MPDFNNCILLQLMNLFHPVLLKVHFYSFLLMLESISIYLDFTDDLVYCFVLYTIHWNVLRLLDYDT